MKSSVAAYIVKLILAVAAIAWCPDASAQRHPERRHIRSGNRQYESGAYAAAEEKYLDAVKSDPASFEGYFNLADALYKQGKYEESVEVLSQIAQAPLITSRQRARVYHNLGNGMFSQQKLKEAAEFYKQSLREDPADLETKYNLAYVQKLLEQQNQNNNDDGKQNQGGGENQQDDNNQQGDSGSPDKDRNGEEEDQDQDCRDDNKNGKDGKDGQGDSEDESPGEPEPQDGSGIKKEDAESILDAMQQQEDKTREKVNEQRAVTVGRSGKNW